MAGKSSELQHVIGIGASAGGLEAIQELIVSLPAELSQSAIIIAQHLSPDYKSMLVELLGRKTNIPIEHAEDGTRIQANRIYIAPPSDDASVVDGAFSMKKPVTVGAHPSVDVLLASLAKEYGERACGIILSGTGKDGSRGIEAIHAAGGMGIVQDPSTARYDGMPQAAIHTGLVEQVLAPNKIGSRLLELVGKNPPAPQTEKSGDIAQETFPQIFELLEHRIGIDFSDYKSSTLLRRLNKRIHERHFTTEDEYLHYVRQNPEELDRLFEALLIGVTAFFRDPEIITQLRKAIRAIIESKKSGDVMRVWVPGCASGEEAYTIAILICEELSASGKRIPIQFFATDIDMKALQRARIGSYPAHAVKLVPKDILNKYFKKINGDTYEVHKDIRKIVLFSKHDVTANPPFLRLDLLSCRNLLIYFNIELQRKVFPLFYYALNPQGFMLLGKSENIGKFQNLFSTFSSSDKIFQRKASEGKKIKFPQLRPHRASDIVRGAPQQVVQEDLTIAEMVKETLFHQYDHAFVVVDDSMDIVEINGDISRYIELKTGSASLNINKLIVRPLQIELRAVTTKAVASMKPVIGALHKLEGEPVQYVRIAAKPLLHSQPNNPYFLISFETVNIDEKLIKMSNVIQESGESPRVMELEHELDATKEHMNSLLEELETSNEELQALNEEMQASNEELQASNEELETSNEELQATNEELENAYTELREANHEIEQQKNKLEQSSENLATLLNNTLVGFIMVDRDYKIMAFNATAKEVYQQLFEVRLKDQTSYLKQLPGSLLPTFHQNFHEALEGHQVVTEEAHKEKGDGMRYFDVNYTPVALNDTDEEARYVVISFVDITERKKAELDLRSAVEELDAEKQFMHTLSSNLPCLIWTTDKDGTYTYCNDYLLNYVGKSFTQMQNLGWQSVIHPDDWAATEQLWSSSLKSGEPMHVEHRIKRHTGEYRWHLTVVDVVGGATKAERTWVGSSVDIEELRRRQEMEQQVEMLENQRKALVNINNTKDEFISLASHQLRTPATAVKQYLGLLLEGYAGPLQDTQSEYIKTAYTSNERQLTTINDLLKTARLDATDITFTKKSHSMSKLIREVIKDVRPMAELKKQELKLSNKGSITADMDYAEMKLAVVNLLENASKYSYPGTTIDIQLRKNKKHVVLSIHDEGVGIAKDQQERIFEKLTRIDNELSDTVTGSGLGLYWVKRIIDLHNGTITVESAPKKGSTFRIELPA